MVVIEFVNGDKESVETKIAYIARGDMKKRADASLSHLFAETAFIQKIL